MGEPVDTNGVRRFTGREAALYADDHDKLSERFVHAADYERLKESYYDLQAQLMCMDAELNGHTEYVEGIVASSEPGLRWEFQRAQQRIADLEAQCARVQRDADRYAWLRDWHTRSMQTAFLSLPSPPWVVRQQIDHGTPTMCGIHTTELDAAIDAAMAAKEAG